MPEIASDIVDAYVFRKVNARVQFLLLLRRPGIVLGNTWQSIHAKVLGNETALQAAERTILAVTGLTTIDAFSADYINQFYDHTTDRIILAPVLAFTVPARSRVQLGDEYTDSAWCDRDEATARLMWSGQRWAIRHIDEVIGLGGSDADFYRIRPLPVEQS